MIFNLLNSITSIGSMVISICVFLNTIKRTQNERRIEKEKELFVLFSSKIISFLEMISPENFWDNYNLIYISKCEEIKNNKEFRNEIFTTIKKSDSKILFDSQEISIYSPDNKIAEIIIDIIKQLKNETLKINDFFCDDINNINRDQNFECITEEKEEILDFYYNNYKFNRDIIFNNLHIIQKYIGKIIPKKELDKIKEELDKNK